MGHRRLPALPGQDALFALFDVPPSPPHVITGTSDEPSWQDGPWNYACHMFQKTGPSMWKLGFTDVSVLGRSRQIACVPVAWWPGTMQDEHGMHRTWKVNRVSPAAEFFYHGPAMDRWVLRQIMAMPETLRGRQGDVYMDIMQRFYREGTQAA